MEYYRGKSKESLFFIYTFMSISDEQLILLRNLLCSQVDSVFIIYITISVVRLTINLFCNHTLYLAINGTPRIPVCSNLCMLTVSSTSKAA